MQQIPRMQSEDREIVQLQNNFLQVINPLLKKNPIFFGTTLKKIELVSGPNTINTGLTEQLQGWSVIRKRSAAEIYDLQDSNNVIGTLILQSNATVTVDLLVF